MNQVIAGNVREPGALGITGKGLRKELWLNPSDWHLKNPLFHVGYYSTNNHLGYHKILKVAGYDLVQLLELAGLNNGENHTLSFVSSDGLVWKETIISLQHRFYHPHLMGDAGLPVAPMIGLYVVQLFDSQAPEPPVRWKDREITEDDYDHQRPRLYKGQTAGNPSDDNQPSFVGNLERIVVGEAL